MRLINADRIDWNMAKLYDYKDLHWANVWEIPTEIDLVKCEECRFYTGKNHLAVNNSSYGFCEKLINMLLLIFIVLMEKGIKNDRFTESYKFS